MRCLIIYTNNLGTFTATFNGRLDTADCIETGNTSAITQNNDSIYANSDTSPNQDSRGMRSANISHMDFGHAFAFRMQEDLASVWHIDAETANDYDSMARDLHADSVYYVKEKLRLDRDYQDQENYKYKTSEELDTFLSEFSIKND